MCKTLFGARTANIEIQKIRNAIVAILYNGNSQDQMTGSALMENQLNKKEGLSKMEFGRMTNYDFLRTLSKKEFAHIFVKLRLDAAEESDWLEWMDMPCNKEEWEQILK